MDRNKLLLFILALLIFVRFIMVPWIEWQDEQRVELHTLVKKLARSESLLAARADVVARHKMAKEIAIGLKQGVAQTPEPAQYRVNFQEALQAKLDSTQVQLSSFEWLSDLDVGAFSIKRGRVNIRLKGGLADIVLAHSALELDYPGLKVKDLRASWQGPLNQYSVLEMQLTIEIDYLVTNA